jgi:hypothetical protein
MAETTRTAVVSGESKHSEQQAERSAIHFGLSNTSEADAFEGHDRKDTSTWHIASPSP